MIRLIRPVHIDAQVVGLLGSEHGEVHTELLQVQTRHFFVQLLGQDVNTQLVVVGVVPHLDLRQHLVGEAGAHYEGAFVATGDSGLKACSDWASFGSSPPSLV